MSTPPPQPDIAALLQQVLEAQRGFQETQQSFQDELNQIRVRTGPPGFQALGCMFNVHRELGIQSRLLY